MNSLEMQRACRSGLFFLFALALIAPPLFVITTSSYGYIIPKASVFFLIVDLMVLIVIFLPFPEKQRLSALLKEPLSVLLLLFLFFHIVSTFVGVNVERSLFGAAYRMLGVVPLMHFLLFYFLLRLFCLQEKYLVRFAFFSVITALLVSLLAVLESFFPIDQPFSTFGNVAFLGQYLLLHFFLAWWLMKKYPSWWGKMSYAMIMMIMAFSIINTGRRGIFLGFLFGLGLLVLFQLKGILKEKHISIGWWFLKIGAGLAIGVLFFTLVTNHYPDSSFSKNVKRLTSISWQSPTVKTRWIVNQISLRAFLDHPFFGIGPENYQYGFSKYYDPFLLNFGIQETIFDKAHNYYFQLLVELGILGTFIFFLLVFFTLWKTQKDALLFSLFASYFFTLLFEVEFTVLFITFFFLLALASSMEALKNIFSREIGDKLAQPRTRSAAGPTCLPAGMAQRIAKKGVAQLHKNLTQIFISLPCASDPASQAPPLRYASLASKKNSRKDVFQSFPSALFLFIFCSVVFLSILYYSSFTFSFFKNEADFNRLLTQDFSAQRVESFFGQAFPLAPWFPFAHLNVVDHNVHQLLSFVAQNPSRLEKVPSHFLQEMGTLLEKSLQDYPHEFRLQLVLCYFYKTWSRSEKSFIKKAEECYGRAMPTHPLSPLYALGLAQFMKLHPNLYAPEKIIEILQALIAREPNLAFPYQELGKFYLEQDRIPEAIAVLEQWLDQVIFIDQVEKLSDIINPLAASKAYPLLLRLFQKMIALFPEDPLWRTKLAMVYLETGDRENAEREGKKAIEMDPQLKKGSDAFFKALEQ